MKKNELYGACSTQGERGEMHTRFWWGNLKERPLGRHRHRWQYNIEMECKVYVYIEHNYV
jgi:hypothetical protein